MSGNRQVGWMLLPALVLVGAVVGLPILRVATLSFMQVDLAEGIVLRWSGLAPYVRLWNDARYWSSVGNTLIFTVASVALEMLLGTAFAMALNQRFAGRSLLRAIVLLPWALPTAVTALAWAWVFNDAFGVANDLLRRASLLDRPVAWLGEPVAAMAVLVLADVWKTTPFVALIVLAGLQGLPQNVMEAARIDGLGPWQRFRHVVLPLLVPSLLVATVFRAVQAYGAFDLVYVMTGGGPGGSTETVSLFSFQQYFRYLDFGYGSAAAIQGVAFALVPLLLVMGWARRMEPR